MANTEYHFEITRVKPLSIQVCTDAPDDAAVSWINAEYPAGTQGGWFISEEFPPVSCAGPGNAHLGYRHILFDC